MEGKEGFKTPEKGEIKLEKGIEGKIDELKEMIEMDFFEQGNAYSIGDFYLDAFGGDWDSVDDVYKEKFLKSLGASLGIDLLNFSEKDVVREFDEPGVKGAPSEGGAKVVVLNTKDYDLEVHVSDYKNPKLKRQYDLVRREVNK